MRALRTPIAVAAAASALALAMASPAQASEENFLKPLQVRFVFLNPQQLLSTGYKVCKAEHDGMTSADASNMVAKDLGVSIAAAVEIVSAAVINLDC
jgi:hypothetical protein